MRRTAGLKLFSKVEGEESNDEEVRAPTWREAVSALKELFYEAITATREDGETRVVGIMVVGQSETAELDLASEEEE